MQHNEMLDRSHCQMLEAITNEIDDAFQCGDRARASGVVSRVRAEFTKELHDGVFGVAFSRLLGSTFCG